MHREIQIKQFPIVTTHWWPKTRYERFVWENEQYLYRFLPLVHNHVQVIWVRTHIRCVTCVCARSGNEWRIHVRDHFRRLRRLTPHSHGASASTPLVDFEWSDVKRYPLNCGSVASLHWCCSRQKLKTFQLFKRQRRRQPIRSPHANTQSRLCNTREVCDWLL